MISPITPTFTVDDRLYETLAEGVALHAPQCAPLTWDVVADPLSWWAVPNEHGDVYKIEITILCTEDLTVRANRWVLPDRRGEPPHNHPWGFTSHILDGGYTEDRYAIAPGGDIVTTRGVSHAAGTVNTVTRELYHEVTEIEHGGATTLMVCGKGTRGTWGYLDLATGEHYRAAHDPGFQDRLHAVNPQHRRPTAR